MKEHMTERLCHAAIVRAPHTHRTLEPQRTWPRVGSQPSFPHQTRAAVGISAHEAVLDGVLRRKHRTTFSVVAFFTVLPMRTSDSKFVKRGRDKVREEYEKVWGDVKCVTQLSVLNPVSPHVRKERTQATIPLSYCSVARRHVHTRGHGVSLHSVGLLGPF